MLQRCAFVAGALVHLKAPVERHLVVPRLLSSDLSCSVRSLLVDCVATSSLAVYRMTLSTCIDITDCNLLDPRPSGQGQTGTWRGVCIRS
jgi:hypothetical protein